MIKINMSREKDPVASLKDLIKRKPNPVPFKDCGNLPWDDPETSKRLLKIHLSQETNQASRTRDQIARECFFMDGVLREITGRESLRILDLTCGPGFYAMEMARLGHQIVGVDFSPAAIEYAMEQLEGTGLPIEYIREDVRKVKFPAESFDGVIYNYSMPNTLPPKDLEAVTGNIAGWLKPGGAYISEILTIEYLQEDQSMEWGIFGNSAFSDKDHLWLDERIWHEPTKAQVYRVHIVDLETNEVSSYAESNQGYTPGEYSTLLSDAGFGTVKIIHGLMGADPENNDRDWISFIAQKL